MLISDFIFSTIILIVLCISLSLLKLLIKNVVYPMFFSKRKDVKKFGNWVVITGATDGIGKAFAELLARDGYNLVLISRSEDKLNNVRNELLSSRSIEIILITADFTQDNIYDLIREKIKDLRIGLLINNVGMSYQFPNYLISGDITDKFASNILNCNCLSAVLMTKLVLNAGMIDKGGFILNISSAMSLVPAPFLTVYGASKSFLNSFSLSMKSELKNSNVTVQNIEPLVVSTKMSRAKSTLLAPSAKSYANSVLNRIGTCSRSHGCLVHEIQGWFITKIPLWLAEKFVYSSMLNIRERALKKMMKNQ